MTKAVLITGAAGFIGRHLVKRVLETTDWRIIAIDSLSYAADTDKLFNDPSYDRKRVRVIWHDFRSPITDEMRRSIGYVDYIVNVASNSHVDRSIENPSSFFLNNTALIANVLEMVRDVAPEKFIQISTDEVFGPAPKRYGHKEWDVHVPSNPYSASKSAQEALSIAYWRTFGVRLIITNTMNNFGEGQNQEKFVPLIIRKLLADKSILVHGQFDNGKFIPGSRYWLHASTHADALIFLLNNAQPNKFPESSRPSRWNIVGDIEIDNEEMVYRVAEILGVQPKIRRDDFHSSRPGHDLRYALDGTKLRNYGFKPSTTFEEALLRNY
jgi:dTDP-glucose 4,6-dehydratase